MTVARPILGAVTAAFLGECQVSRREYIEAKTVTGSVALISVRTIVAMFHKDNKGELLLYTGTVVQLDSSCIESVQRALESVGVDDEDWWKR